MYQGGVCNVDFITVQRDVIRSVLNRCVDLKAELSEVVARMEWVAFAIGSRVDSTGGALFVRQDTVVARAPPPRLRQSSTRWIVCLSGSVRRSFAWSMSLLQGAMRRLGNVIGTTEQYFHRHQA